MTDTKRYPQSQDGLMPQIRDSIQHGAKLVAENQRLEAEVASLKAQIGTPPDDPRLNDPGPRAETWHKERENWFTEVQRLRKALTRLATEGQRVAAIALQTYPNESEVAPCEDFILLCDAYIVH